MKITFRTREGRGDMVLHNQSIADAKRALRMSKVFGVPVMVEADGDDFSRLCTALTHERQNLDEGVEDVHAFHAPSECLKLIVHDSQQRVHRLLEEFGFTPETFLEELDRRVSHKFIYQWSGFGVEVHT